MASDGFELANLGTKGQHATPRPPKPLYVYMCVYIYIKTLNSIANAPTCFSASTPPSGSFDIVFAKVTKY